MIWREARRRMTPIVGDGGDGEGATQKEKKSYVRGRRELAGVSGATPLMRGVLPDNPAASFADPEAD